mgnify:CR=1 FL=1
MSKPIEASIVVVDDEPSIRELLVASLHFAGFDVATAASGSEAIEVIEKTQPDLIVLDVMLPDIDGFTVTRRIRQEGIGAPVLFLTARDDTQDKVMGLTVGGDDYVTKPFIADELLLRIDAHVRRHRGDIEHARKNSTDVSELVRREPCRIGDLEVFFDRYEVHLHGEAVPLTAKEFEILALLAESPGEVFTRRRIYEHLWGEVAEVDENSITVFMRKIREKIEDNPSEPRYLLTVWRVGYKLAAE